MNIWLICQFYKPEPGAPSARLSGFANFWKKMGNDVTVLTAIPNHPNGVIPEEYQGKPAFFEEEIEGVRVSRHWLYVTANEGFLKKTLSHLSFAFSLLKNLFGTSHKPEVIVASSPAFFAAISAWLLSVRYRVPFVMEVRDLWPGIFVELGVLKPGIILSILEWVELFLYKRAAAIVPVTRGFAKDIIGRGIPAEKVHVITNGVSDFEFDNALNPLKDGSVARLRSELQISPLTKVVLYIGTHGTSQALGQIVDAARQLIGRSDILFLFVGDGADKARLKKLASGMPNVQFIPSQPKERVWHFYNLSYASLVPLKDIPGFDTFIPSKMFEIWASGTAVVGCVRGEAANIMTESKGAMVVPPEDAEKLAKAVETIADDPDRAKRMGEDGREHVNNNYRHSQLGQRYIAILEKISERNTQTTPPAPTPAPDPVEQKSA